MTKFSRSPGFGLCGTNPKELLGIRVLVQAHNDLVQALVVLGSGSSSSGKVGMGGKKTGYSGARIWVGWSCLVGVCKRCEGETGLLLTGCSNRIIIEYVWNQNYIYPSANYEAGTHQLFNKSKIQVYKAR